MGWYIRHCNAEQSCDVATRAIKICSRRKSKIMHGVRAAAVDFIPRL